jgi:hypothetical protein
MEKKIFLAFAAFAKEIIKLIIGLILTQIRFR